MYALTIVSFAVFVLYIFTVSLDYRLTTQKPILPSLSESFYFLQSHADGMGYIFTGAMILCIVTITPYWIEVTPTSFQFMPFIGAAGIGFVASAPQFKAEGDEHHVHVYGALVAAVFSLLWCFLMGCGRIVALVVLCVAAAAFVTRSLKTSKIFWAEMVAFFSVYASLLTL